MGLFGKKKNEDKEKIVEGEVFLNEKDILKENVKSEEEEEMAKGDTKKKYIYLAMDDEKNVLLDKYGEPIFSNITENGKKIDWPEHARCYGDKIRGYEEYREEIDESLIYKKGKNKKNNYAAKQAAKDRLKERAIEKIQEAKEKFQKKGNEEDKTKIETNIKCQVNQDTDDLGINYESVDEKKDGEKKNTSENNAIFSEQNVMKASEILDSLNEVEKNIRRDFSDAVYDFVETSSVNSKKVSELIQKEKESLEQIVIKCTENAVKHVEQKTHTNTENIIGRINESGKSLKDNQQQIMTKIRSASKAIEECEESIETMEGTLHKLEQLDEIAELLRDKGVNISREIPAVNAEEEDIINLVRYSQKISEQLGYAARELIRKKKTFADQAQNNANEQDVIKQKISQARDEGEKKGQLYVVKQLLGKYADIDAIKESKDEYVHVIWTMLTELGVEIDGEGVFEKGEIIDFQDEDIQKMVGTYSKLEGAGKYKVTKTGLIFNSDIICKAEFEKIKEETSEDTKDENNSPKEDAEETENEKN